MDMLRKPLKIPENPRSSCDGFVKESNFGDGGKELLEGETLRRELYILEKFPTEAVGERRPSHLASVTRPGGGGKFRFSSSPVVTTCNNNQIQKPS